MKITAIKQQIKQPGRYSIFIDGKYALSLSDTALLDSKLISGQELSKQQVDKYKQLSSDDKLYSSALRYATLRFRTKWEIETYLSAKHPSPSLYNSILNKLSEYDLINDKKFAYAFVSDRQLLRPTSNRKLILELRQKHVSDEIIQKVMQTATKALEKQSLMTILRSKRKQTRYKDDLKLMQYLSRQGFNYDDIKTAMKTEIDDY